MGLEKKRSFPCYMDYETPLKLLTLEEIGKLWLAMFEYERTGTEPEFTGALAMAFCFIRSQMDRDREAYAEKCRVNAENGKKGGRPQKIAEETPKTEETIKTENPFERC